MEPHGSSSSSSSRAEAERWLVIAEKLLMTRDLIGSKTFAIRATESVPRLDAADRILAVADTLLAGEKRVNNQNDWYAILQLGHWTQDSELVATQYRRLALLLNPIKNKLPFAPEAFKLICDAWSVLSNPYKKAIYDNELNLFTGSQHPILNLNPRNAIDLDVDNNATQGTQNPLNRDDSPNFWTACPYCYTMFEYPRVYEDCTLRCQKCRRAFHAVVVPSPPSITEGKDAYFCSWGYYPLGVSDSNQGKGKGKGKGKGGGSTWAPFSPMFTCPQVARPRPKLKSTNLRKSWAPRVYIEDDPDGFVEISDPSDDSDDEWGTPRKKKKAKSAKRKGSAGRKPGKQQIDKGKSVQVSDGENLQGGSAMQEGAPIGVPNPTSAETVKKAVASNSRKLPGRRVARELGKLDLNVEFSNEVEEPVMGINGGVEDAIEGTGFFEGLDEFLSSLPILSVVGDDKVKATQ